MVNKQISYEFGIEVRKAAKKMEEQGIIHDSNNTFGYIDFFVVKNTKKGIDLEKSLIHIANRLNFFSRIFFNKLRECKKTQGRFCIDEVEFLRAILATEN